jgi:voltage-gated sodium channel
MESLRTLVDSRRFAAFITALILFNGLILGLATSKPLMADYGTLIERIDQLIVAVFTVEILLRIAVHRLAFFKDPWSLFDFIVVAISLVPASGPLSILRVLRVLRLFRLLTVVPQMRRIVAALVSVIPGIGSIAVIVTLFFYVFAIMATEMFGGRFAEWFGTLGASLYTLFQIMTLESWSMGIARPVMEVYPYAWVFFLSFILLVTFVMVNLLIGIIVDAIFALKEEEKAPEDPASLHREIDELKRLIASMERKLPPRAG